jgi:acyl carrier protein
MGVEQLQTGSPVIQELMNYINQKIRGKAPISEDTPLVSSGLIDSFSLIEIFLELQRIAGLKVPPSKVQAKDLDTVRMMFRTAEKFGKPVKN